MANIDDFLAQQGNEGQQPPGGQQQQLGPQPDPQVTAVAEENARLRAEMEQMKADMARFRAGGQVAPVTPPEDPWQAHIRGVLREAKIGANEFVESPMDTFVRATAATLQSARGMWQEDVKQMNTSFRLDSKFEERYPDLYATDNRKKIVEVALLELRGDPKFSRFLGTTETLPQALDMLADNTYKMLGVDNPHRAGGGEATEPAPVLPQRKGTYGTPGGSRITGSGPVSDDKQASEVSGMIRYLQGGGRGGV